MTYLKGKNNSISKYSIKSNPKNTKMNESKFLECELSAYVLWRFSNPKSGIFGHIFELTFFRQHMKLTRTFNQKSNDIFHISVIRYFRKYSRSWNVLAEF